jgi:integral membrane sensor domain MASE1
MKRASHWIAAIIAVPFGVLLGGVSGSVICFAILRAQGMGHSHNDMFTIFSAQVSGAIAGLLLLPPLAWHLEKRRKNRSKIEFTGD